MWPTSFHLIVHLVTTAHTLNWYVFTYNKNCETSDTSVELSTIFGFLFASDINPLLVSEGEREINGKICTYEYTVHVERAQSWVCIDMRQWAPCESYPHDSYTSYWTAMKLRGKKEGNLWLINVRNKQILVENLENNIYIYLQKLTATTTMTTQMWDYIKWFSYLFLLRLLTLVLHCLYILTT